MTPSYTVSAIFERWVVLGWLSRLNRAFALFLRDMDPNASPDVLLAGALVSRRLDQGDVSLDLGAFLQCPTALLATGNESEHAALTSELAAFGLSGLEPWRSALSKSPLVGDGPGNTPLVLEDNRLYLRRYWQYRQTLADAIDSRLRPTRASLPITVAERLQALFPHQTVEPDWQKVACALALRGRLCIISGGPGTGKTTTLAKLLVLLIELTLHENEGTRLPRILLAAPTGKAAARVGEAITKAISGLDIADNIKAALPQQASTLHRLMGSSRHSRQFLHHRRNPLAADAIVIDEASMIDLEMMAVLLEALPEQAQLILLGDKDQLASVEPGSVLGDLCVNADANAYDSDTLAWIERYAGAKITPPVNVGSAINQQTVMLQQSFRFGADAGIGRLAEAVNTGDAVLADSILNDSGRYPDLCPVAPDAYRHLRTNPHAESAEQLLKTWVLTGRSRRSESNPEDTGYGDYLQVIKDQRPRDSDIFDDWARRVLDAFDRFRVLTAMRNGHWGVEALNRRIEAWLFPNRATGQWYEGRPVMVTQNDYGLDLMNGDIGIALTDSEGRLRVVFAANEATAPAKIRWLSPLRLSSVETAFAMTVHKAQGSEYDHVALVLPERMTPVLSRELLYTGITRAKNRFTLIESAPGVFAAAVKSRLKNATDQKSGG